MAELEHENRPISILLGEIDARMESVIGQNNVFGYRDMPGIGEHHIEVCLYVQYDKDDVPDFSKDPLSKLEWDKQIAIRNAMRPGAVILNNADGATREDAVRNLWRKIFLYEGHY